MDRWKTTRVSWLSGGLAPTFPASSSDAGAEVVGHAPPALYSALIPNTMRGSDELDPPSSLSLLGYLNSRITQFID